MQRCRRVVRWPLAQVDGEQGEHAGSTHGAHPHPPSTSNSQDSPQHLGTSESPPLPSAGTFCHLPQHRMSPKSMNTVLGGVKGSSETFNSPCADNSCFDCPTSTRLSKATGVFCSFIMIYALILLISLLKKVSEPHYYPSTERT